MMVDFCGCCVSGRLLVTDVGVNRQLLACGKTCSKSAVNLCWMLVLNLYMLFESSVVWCAVDELPPPLRLLLLLLDDEPLLERVSVASPLVVASNIWRSCDDAPDASDRLPPDDEPPL